ncbi:Hypothetical predicted protein, partial [Paramuricea clavata]
MAVFKTLCRYIVFVAFLLTVFDRKHQTTEEFYSGDLSAVLAASNEANKLQILPINNSLAPRSRVASRSGKPIDRAEERARFIRFIHLARNE